MSYKTDVEKGFKLIRCISPPIIFVNDPIGIGKSSFVNRFKKEGFSVLTISNEINVGKIHKYLENRKDKSFDHNPIIIEAKIQDEKIISDIFSNEFHNFTYVYIYPNNPKKYKENLSQNIDQEINIPNLNNLIEEVRSSDSREQLLNKLTLELINLNKLIYNKHLEIFDNKILTILI